MIRGPDGKRYTPEEYEKLSQEKQDKVVDTLIDDMRNVLELNVRRMRTAVLVAFALGFLLGVALIFSLDQLFGR